jgi:undecaprenyl pyrophosphate phosphatase UppP
MQNKPKSRILKWFLTAVGFVCGLVAALCVIAMVVALAEGNNKNTPWAGYVILIALLSFASYKLNKLANRN